MTPTFQMSMLSSSSETSETLVSYPSTTRQDPEDLSFELYRREEPQNWFLMHGRH